MSRSSLEFKNLQVRNTMQALLQSGMVWHALASRSETSINGIVSQSPLAGVPFGVHEIDSHLPHCGLQRSAIHEFCSCADDSHSIFSPTAILSILAGNALKARATGAGFDDSSANQYIIWIGSRCWPSPFLLAQTVGALNRCLFVDPPDAMQALWAMDYALRSPAVAGVIADCTNSSVKNPKITAAIGRRLAIAARANSAISKTLGVLGILIRDSRDFTQPTVAASRWKISHHPPSKGNSTYANALCFDLELLRCKSQAPHTTKWCLELTDTTTSGGSYETTIAPLRMRLFSAASDRSREHFQGEKQQRYG